jgi:iron complex outermembrane recepter protein
MAPNAKTGGCVMFYSHKWVLFGERRSRWLGSTMMAVLLLFPCGEVEAQDQPAPAQPSPGQTPPNPNLPPVTVVKPVKRQSTAKPGGAGTTAGRSAPRAPRVVTQQPPQPIPPSTQSGTAQVAPGTPGPNLNAVAPSATRLDLPLRETPATVEVVDQQTIQDQGYRTTTEIAKGAVGVLDLDSSGAPANFSMRGFTFGAVNVLYNGISIGVASDTTRVMDTDNLDQVEFLKGPSALMSGMMAIGGAVNYVSRQPTTGPIQNELDLSLDSYGSYRTHYGSGGSTTVDGLDYRIDITESKINSFVDGDFRDLGDLSAQLNYRANNEFKTFVAVEYKEDSGHAYWGTPLVPVSFAGSHAVNGVVSGNAFSTFSGDNLGPMTIDGRTITTNYNVADNSTGAKELWLRSGFEWTPLNNVTVKDQVYYYRAQRNWLDSETYAFDNGAVFAPNVIDRDRFFVTHNQHVAGNNLDFLADSRLFGMDNRLAAQLQLSSDRITFVQEGNPSDYPYDFVSVIDPVQGVYGTEFPQIFNKRLDDVALAVEDRLKVTPEFALIGGIRVDDWMLTSNTVNCSICSPIPGEPFSQTWKPVSYRAAYTYEPISNLIFYSMFATSYDPAVADVFFVSANTPLALTSTEIYETGVKQLFWDKKAEWTFAAYDIDRRNVYVPITETTSTLAGEIASKGIELAGAVRPIEGLKLWGNVAWTQARYEDFAAVLDPVTGVVENWNGNTPSNVAPVIFNAGASYRFDHWRWPVEFGGSVRHVGNRYLFEDDATIMNAYTTVDVYAFVDIPGRDFGRPEISDMRLTFRVRNLTNQTYAAFSDPGYPDQVYLGDPRTYEIGAHFKW